jgi:hypothetical protein
MIEQKDGVICLLELALGIETADGEERKSLKGNLCHLYRNPQH